MAIVNSLLFQCGINFRRQILIRSKIGPRIERDKYWQGDKR